jgi:hypothetical protein
MKFSIIRKVCKTDYLLGEKKFEVEKKQRKKFSSRFSSVVRPELSSFSSQPTHGHVMSRSHPKNWKSIKLQERCHQLYSKKENCRNKRRIFSFLLENFLCFFTASETTFPFVKIYRHIFCQLDDINWAFFLRLPYFSFFFTAFVCHYGNLLDLIVRWKLQDFLVPKNYVREFCTWIRKILCMRWNYITHRTKISSRCRHFHIRPTIKM